MTVKRPSPDKINDRHNRVPKGKITITSDRMKTTAFFVLVYFVTET